MDEVILRVDGLSKSYPVGGSLLTSPGLLVKAVERVSFQLERQAALGVVGESGSGKSTLGLLVLRLIEPTCGSVYFADKDIFRLGKREMRQLRRRMQIVFQDPDSSLNPRRTVRQALSEPLIIHGLGSGGEVLQRVVDALERVGLGREHLGRYPHELSGGQKQRVAIARALVMFPEFVVFDEPTSALDVSVQARILELIRGIKTQMNLTYLFISHDLSVVRHLCEDVAVMYLGRIVEKASADKLFHSPLHPYTQALLSSIPSADPHKRKLVAGGTVMGEPPSHLFHPPGCSFHPRCPFVMDECKTVEPHLLQAESGHSVACHLYGSATGHPVAARQRGTWHA